MGKKKYIRIILFIIPIFVILTLALSPKHSYAQGWFSSFWRKLDAHELGTWNHLEKTEASGLVATRALVSANAVTLGHRRQGASHDHSDQLAAAQCRMIQTINGFYAIAGTKNPRKLQYPKTLQWRRYYVRRFRSFAQRLKGYKYCSDVPQSVLNDMFSIVYNYEKARNTFISNVEKRPRNYRDSQWSASLAAEIPGVPLKFDLRNGELKLKLQTRIAGVKVDSQISRSSKRSGIKTVIIRTHGKVYFYEIDNKPITFEVPSSTIQFSGDTATIIYQ